MRASHYSNVTPMSAAQAKDAARIEDTRRHQSREASKNAGGKQDGKYLRRARAVLNDRRNYHSRHPNSSGGHACKAPGSMKG